MSDNVVAFGDRTMVADRPVAAAMQPAPPDAPSPSRHSPHILSFDDFAATFGGSPRRRELLALVTRELGHLRSHGVTPLCLLVGGSFVRDGATPDDLDALVVYRIVPGDMADALQVLRTRRRAGLDLRFVPGDASPLPLVKMSCFFHTLCQSRDREGAQASFLLPLDP